MTQKGNTMRRRAAGAGAAAIGAVTAITALVIGMTAGHAETTTSSAYGIAAVGPIPIEPTPFVESTDGTDQTSTQLELPENPLIALAAAKVNAGESTASVKLVDLALAPGAELPEELAPLQDALDQLAEGLAPLCEAGDPIEQIPPNPITDLIPEGALDPQQLCDSLSGGAPALLEVGLVEVFCEGDTGGLDVADITLLGQDIPIPPVEPNMVIIPPNPLLSITANKQTENEDGSFTVEGLVIDVGEGTEVITLGSATCGGAGEEPTAPAPTPVTTPLPVTG